ncbi:MAG: c-type cytochrome [Ignavibacteriales bacterium]|nr:c-type cytochrome [Ignavibacteriales bacterium]
MIHPHKKLVLYLFLSLTGTTFLFLLFNEKLFTHPFPSETSISEPNLGKTIYNDKCSYCHGANGKGDGIPAAALNPRPRNFADGKFKIRTTESGSIPTDEDLMNTVSNGLHGSTMPAWKTFLRGDSLMAVVNYVKSLSPRFQNEQPKPIKMSAEIPSSATADKSEKSIANGKKVYQNLQCGSCHGDDGNGTNATSTNLKDDLERSIVAANLTEPWNFKGGATAKDIYLRFRTGMDGTPMPSYVGAASETEMWDLANYVVSLSRKPVWEMNESELKNFYAQQESDWKKNPLARGKYIVESRGCTDCHSPIDEHEKLIEGLELAGGQRWSLGAYGDFYAPNLTPDKETGLGNWTFEEFKNAFTRGIKKDGSRMLPFPMPWTAYVNYSDDDLHAIFSYLQSLPPIYNKIPENKPLGTFSYLIAKFKWLILKKDFAAYIYPGNAGTTSNNNSTKENEQ